MQDLVDRLSLDEMVLQMARGGARNNGTRLYIITTTRNTGADYCDVIYVDHRHTIIANCLLPTVFSLSRPSSCHRSSWHQALPVGYGVPQWRC